MRLKHLLAAERQKLTRDRCRFARGVMDQFDFRKHWRIIVKTVENDFASADNNGQQVVEVVCNTSRQSSNRLHALSASDFLFEPFAASFRAIPFRNFRPQDFVGSGQIGGAAFHTLFQFVMGRLKILFKSLAIGDVADMKKHRRLSVVVDAAGADGNMNPLAIGGEAEPFILLDAFCNFAADECAAFRWKQFGAGFSDQKLSGSSMQRGRSRIAIQYISIFVFDEDRIWRTFEERAEESLSLHDEILTILRGRESLEFRYVVLDVACENSGRDAISMPISRIRSVIDRSPRCDAIRERRCSAIWSFA